MMNKMIISVMMNINMNMRRITVMITIKITGGRGMERLDKFVEGCGGSGAEVFDEWKEQDQIQEEGEKRSSVGGGWVGCGDR